MKLRKKASVRHLVKGIVFLLLLLGTLLNAHAQKKDSLGVEVGAGVVTGTEDFLPHYLVNNQWGEVNEDQNLFLRGDLLYQNQLSERLSFKTGFSFRNDLLSAHYVQLKYSEFEFTAGRFKRQIGGLGNDLSSGSLAMGNNARPIPMIGLALPNYVDVPFTGGYFKTKGHLSHGWLGEEGQVVDAQLHSKSFYLMLDLTDEIGVTAASGVVHFAQFGGTSSVWGAQPSAFSDFLRVFVGAGIPNPDGTTAGESNAVGNHLGIVETTVTKKLGDHKLTVNYQKPFEDEGGLQYVSLTDYLFGIEWELPKEGRLVNKVYVEYIQTRWQGGPGIPDPNGVIETVEDNFGYAFGGRDDLYNNWIYSNGWSYDGQVIGNPLFLTYQRTLNFFDIYPDYGVAIANNRIRAVHLGLEGELGQGLDYRMLMTYTSNSGTYAGQYGGRFNWEGVNSGGPFTYVFRPAQSQYYTMVEVKKRGILANKAMDLLIRLAIDTGELYDNAGAEVMLTYRLSKH